MSYDSATPELREAILRRALRAAYVPRIFNSSDVDWAGPEADSDWVNMVEVRKLAERIRQGKRAIKPTLAFERRKEGAK